MQTKVIHEDVLIKTYIMVAKKKESKRGKRYKERKRLKTAFIEIFDPIVFYSFYGLNVIYTQ